ncbi:diaminopimelate epimerase [uncultured Vagococcus sp.]|uniref:diaminopimelate epimerase n=1 Tax=uncultured Vagococcus sp. TaxID=189676 RepID=UPI0028D3F52F|nr:diaminopimelate epimerase [uncultured Vagococcus sp.]
MKVRKYNGCGNDFVIIDDRAGLDYNTLAQELCQDSQFDTDGLIGVKQEPLEMIFYNRDGSRAPMCGNGIRCFAKYVYEAGIVTEKEFPVETLAGTLTVRITQEEPFECRVQMGQAYYDNQLIGASDQESFQQRTIELSTGMVEITSLFVGTIHTVVFVEDAVAEIELSRGSEICHHPLFKEQTNVNFVQVLNEQELLVRTFERGVGWTLACGTGCCAAYVVARDLGKVTSQPVIVHLEQGQLEISGDAEIIMAGPAVFEKEVTV